MNYNIIVVDRFVKELKALKKKYPSLLADIETVRQELISNPTTGIPLGKNCYKIRFSIKSKGKGKSGGGRLITCIKVIGKIIYLLSVYDKSERVTVSDEALHEILKEENLL